MILKWVFRPVFCIASIDPRIIHNHVATTHNPERCTKGIKDETSTETNLTYLGCISVHRYAANCGEMIKDREYQIKPFENAKTD